MSGDNFFRSNVLLNCFASAVYLAYASTSAYYYNEAKSLSTDSQSFESMFYVSLVIAGLSFISFMYFAYKLLLLETEISIEPIKDTAELSDFDYSKLDKMQNIRTKIFENPTSIGRRETYQAPTSINKQFLPPVQNNFGPIINSTGF